MTQVLIGFVGAPSCGKSTTAAKLFSRLKDMGLNVELVTEFCKTWAWDEREITPYSQFYFFGKQSYAESRLFNKVDYIVTDSPVLLSAFYQEYYNEDSSLCPACHEFYRKVAEDNIIVLNFFLPRKKKYVARGRYQSEREADQVAELLQEWLSKENYPYKVLDCPDEERVDIVLGNLEEVVGGFDGISMA
jgi:hypothetical protein